MMASLEPRKSPFSVVNGIEVYDNGADPPIWRCPKCQWWREWADEKCVVCQTPRPVTPPK